MNQKQRQTKKFYLLLPVLVLPFTAVIFVLLGGGQLAAVSAVKPNGLNLHLPEAHNINDTSKDKLSFYAMAARDSSRYAEAVKNDPYRQVSTQVDENKMEDKDIANLMQRFCPKPITAFAQTKPEETQNTKPADNKENGTTDPEIESINTALDKLMVLQQPKSAVINGDKNSMRVTVSADNEDTYFGKMDSGKGNQFYDIPYSQSDEPAMYAVLPVTQTLQDGSVVKLQLLQPILVGRHRLPAYSFVFGVVSMQAQRMIIHVPSIRVGDIVMSVALSVYDLDGLEGISAPGSAAMETMKASADQALQSVNVLSLDPSIKTQAVMAGIGATKNLLSKKVKTQRITVSGGYRVLLRDVKIN